MKPTAEQAAVVDAARNGAHLVIEAFAGAGKTSTLKLLARAKPNRGGVYLAYNRAIAADAAKSFPSTVVCKTAHALAFAAVGKAYKERLDAARQPARVTAQLLGINQPVDLGTDVVKLAPQQVARIVLSTVDRFCQSADTFIGRRHVPRLHGFEAPAARAALAEVIVPIARKAWEDVTNPKGKLRFTHDCYLKLWQLDDPDLRCDYVLLDEAQDSNPAVAAVVDGQRNAQRILVGDRYQAIYGWRGAVDAMENFQGTRLHLSQSFRFGAAIADEANKWLQLLGAAAKLRGFDQIDSRLERGGDVDAILCRTNGGAITRVIHALAAGQRVALVGGGDDMRRYAEAAQQLLRGEPCGHPELMAFSSWGEVRDYVQQDAGGADLKVIVDLIDTHGPDAIIRLTHQLVGEDRAELIISTAHKAKGREWHQVRVADDFREPIPNPETGRASLARDDAMLAYVTVTRAQHVLDRTGLAWVDRWVDARTDRQRFDDLLDASSLGAPDVRDAIAADPFDQAARLTGMPEEQADWDSDAPPAAPKRHEGECRGLCDDNFPTRCLWSAPSTAGASS